MNFKESLYRFIFLCAAALTLAACNGGDDDEGTGALPGQTWFFPAGAVLTDSQSSNFDAQGLYFNVHSSANSGGEIRSQIIPAPSRFATDAGAPSTSNTFSALLSGSQEVPANASQASGYGTIVLDPAAKTLTGVLVTNGVVGTGAHIHNGPSGANGPVVVTLTGGPTVWTVPADTVLTDEQVASLAAGSYYLNVHTSAAPDGEIRGQLTQQLRFAALSGANEVPAVTTSATGTGVLAYDPATNRISGFVQTSGIVGTQAHIHEGAAGTNGGVIVTLTETPAGSGYWVVPAGSTLSAAQAVSFNSNGLYFNVHSQANLEGEIRGQIVASTITIGNGVLDGSREVPPVNTSATGTGIMALNSISRQVYGNIATSLIAGTEAHVHEGAAGVNGPAIIPLTPTPPPSTFQPQVTPLVVSTTSLTSGAVGTAYSQFLTAAGGTAPYTWTVASGVLPAGLMLSPAGVISGTPTTAGTANFTASVTDSGSPAATATRTLSLDVTAYPSATVSFATQGQPTANE